MVEMRDSQYQAALKMLSGAEDALLHAMSSVKRKAETSMLRRQIEEVEALLKKAKRELKVG